MLQSPRENKAPKEHLTKDPKLHNIKKNEAKTFRKKKIIHYDFTAVITNPASYYRSHGSIKTFNILPVDHINCHALKKPRLRQTSKSLFSTLQKSEWCMTFIYIMAKQPLKRRIILMS